jgi:ABC-type branched-subunit amino acid transport system ATPase component
VGWLARRAEARAGARGLTVPVSGIEERRATEPNDESRRVTAAAAYAARHTSRPEGAMEAGLDIAPGQEVLALEAENVTVRFGTLVALSEVTLHIKAGEIVGLIGNNGAGKSTFINCVAGTVRPRGGTLRMFGIDLTNVAGTSRRHLGLSRTFQDARLFEGLSVREIVQLALTGAEHSDLLSSALQMPWVRLENAWTRARAVEILESLGLMDYADTAAVELPTGVRRICDLAVQIAVQPRLLLLDEPTAGLAQRESEAFVPLMRRLSSDLGTSVLIVEHDMPVILGVTDRIYCLELGRVIAEGTPDEIRQDPRVIESYIGGREGITPMVVGSVMTASREPETL